MSLTDDAGAIFTLTPQTFVIAGYTGRDRALVQRHIDELERAGIPPPPAVPMWYEMPSEILTTDVAVTVRGAGISERSSGEVEPVLIGSAGALYLGIGSDHTDRTLERSDIAASKRACPKPVGTTVMRLTAPSAELDGLMLESWIDDELYQRGTFAQLLPLGQLLEAFRTRAPLEPFVLFCGTVPLLGHTFRFGRAFRARISGPPLATPLTLAYTL